MKTFSKEIQAARQGEVYIVRICDLPKDAKKSEPKNGKYILGHSETGHHHVIEAKPNVSFYSSDEPLVTYLQVVEATDAAETVLEHLRNFDTHESIGLTEGVYAVINGRESSPEGWRRVQD